MWHPFDLIPDELALAAEFRTLQPPANRTVLFTQRALTYFKDKSSKTEQWPLMMDELPGTRITRRGRAELELAVSHQWKLDYFRTLSGDMTCSGAWHSPQTWSFRRTCKPLFPGAFAFAPVAIQGRWQAGKLEQTHVGSVRKQQQLAKAGNLLSIYALMSGFPLRQNLPETFVTLLGEDLVVRSQGRILRSPPATQNHPQAEGLTGFLVEAAGDFPTELWVNEHGLVVYVFNGISKVFVLTGVEEAT